MVSSLIFSLLVPILAGCSFVSYLTHPLKISLKLILALGVMIGLGLVPQTILVLDTIGIQWNLVNVYTSLGIVAGVCLTLRFFKKKTFLEQTADVQVKANVTLYPADQTATWPYRLLFYVLLAYVLFISYIIYWKALNLPVFVWDSLATAILNQRYFIMSVI